MNEQCTKAKDMFFKKYKGTNSYKKIEFWRTNIWQGNSKYLKNNFYLLILPQ